jgi:hypothetical protein
MVAPGGWPVESAALSARPVVVANVHGRGTSRVLSLLRPSPVGLPVLLGLESGKRADVLPALGSRAPEPGLETTGTSAALWDRDRQVWATASAGRAGAAREPAGARRRAPPE